MRSAVETKSYAARMARAPFQVVVVPFRIGNDGCEYAAFRRADDDAWQWITGGREDSESPLQSARREASEEAGVSPRTPFYRLATLHSVPVTHFAADLMAARHLRHSGVLLRVRGEGSHTNALRGTLRMALGQLRRGSTAPALRMQPRGAVRTSRTTPSRRLARPSLTRRPLIERAEVDRPSFECG